MISSLLLVLLTFVTGCGDDRVSDLPIEELLWGTWEYRPSNDTFKDLGVGEGQLWKTCTYQSDGMSSCTWTVKPGETGRYRWWVTRNLLFERYVGDKIRDEKPYFIDVKDRDTSQAHTYNPIPFSFSCTPPVSSFDAWQRNSKPRRRRSSSRRS